MKYAELHLHSMDRFDSQNDPERVCERLKEMDAKGFVLTQHGVLSGVEPMRKAAEKAGLKFSEGCELYVSSGTEKAHLICIALNDTGAHSLEKLVSDSQDENGYAVTTDEILAKYFGPGAEGHGQAVFTSACINGVIAKELRKNELLLKKITKAKAKLDQKQYSEKEHDAAKTELVMIGKQLENAIAARDEAKKAAEKKFAAKEKKLETMKNSADPNAAAFEDQLNKEKKEAEAAKEKLPKEKERVQALQKQERDAKRALKEFDAAAVETGMIRTEIDELKKSIKQTDMLERDAEEKTEYYRSLFGEDCFYMEIQNHGIELEAEIYPTLARIARKLHVPIVASNDVHTVGNSSEELLQRRTMRALRFQSYQEDAEGDDQLYIKSDEEMESWLKRILPDDVVKEGIQNIRTIFDRCHMEWKTEKHYPAFKSDSKKSAEELLDDAVKAGIHWRFPNGLDDEHRERLTKELAIIKKMGYANYHLVVKDYIAYGRLLAAVPDEKIEAAPLSIAALKKQIRENGWVSNGITIGPGRGSAVGSLVCYLLGITNLDPIPFGLLFERFLNPERVSMPDIDVDFSFRTRAKAIDYVKEKYGKDAVCGIMTVNAQAPKGAIRIAAKYYGQKKLMESGQAVTPEKMKKYLHYGDELAIKVPSEPGTKFSSMLNDEWTVYKALNCVYGTQEDYREILTWAHAIEGMFTAYGSHAAGIVISDGTPIKEILPLRYNKETGGMTTQCDMITVEEKGLLKFDFLGLRTLDVITDTLRMITKRTGKIIDPLNIPLNDKEVYSKIFASGCTNSVFQFESTGMKQMLKRFRPDRFDDLIILVAMFRPGPLQYLDSVIDVKNGVTHAAYLTPELKPILGSTYGAIVYQEQVMEIFQKLAGYSLGGADMVRRAMSKKKLEKLEKERKAFVYGDESRNIKGCKANGIDPEKANELFDQMTDFARYAFNKSHAAAYAFNSYLTAWLKKHYPAEFMTAAMNWAVTDKIPGLMAEAKTLGIEVLAPDINRSDSKFSVTKDGKILFGLSSIKTVGTTADNILSERKNGEYSSFYDFIRRTNAKKNAVENLVKAGAFDTFCKNRTALLRIIDPCRTAAKRVAEKTESYEDVRVMLPYVLGLKLDEEASHDHSVSEKLEKQINSAKKAMEDAIANAEGLCPDESVAEDMKKRMEDEKSLLGAYVTMHPLDQYPSAAELKATPISCISDYTGVIFGVITDIRLKKRKADGANMAFFTLEDKTSKIEVCVFSAAYKKNSGYIKDGNVVLIKGVSRMQDTYLQDENGNRIKEMTFIAESIQSI